MKGVSIADGLRTVAFAPHESPAKGATKLRAPDAPYRAEKSEPSKRSDVPTTIVRLPNGREVLLPGGSGPESFAAYIQRVAKTNTFSSQRDALRALAVTPVVTATPDERPVVGIVIPEPRHLTSDSENAVAKTVHAVEAMGCRPVIIPPRADLAVADPHERVGDVVDSMVRQLDGVIGLGGPDVHPNLYGALHRGAVETNLPRDRFEAAFVRAALDARVFMLGICRSHQLWNVATGGSLSQDVEGDRLASSTRDQRTLDIPMAKAYAIRGGYENRVRVRGGSRLRGMLGRDSLVTNSAHHQAVTKTGQRFEAVAHTVDPILGKRMIAGTETDRAITVQFHPELREDDAPERALVDGLCRRAKIFAIVRRLEANGEDATVDEILDAMKGGGFDLPDHRWVREDLARLLTRTKNAAA